jgi:hypothetical protein
VSTTALTASAMASAPNCVESTCLREPVTERHQQSESRVVRTPGRRQPSQAMRAEARPRPRSLAERDRCWQCPAQLQVP